MKYFSQLIGWPNSSLSAGLTHRAALMGALFCSSSGTVFAQSGPVASVSTPVQFGTIDFGSTLTMEVPVTNAGLGSLTIAPSINGPSYKVVGAEPANCQAGTAAGQTCTLEVEFSPVTVGPHDDNLTLQTNGAASPVVRLRGLASGIGTKMEGPLHFPTIPAGASVILPVRISDYVVTNSPTDFSYFLQSISGPSFRLLANEDNLYICDGVMIYGETCDLLVEFKPQAEGVHDETIAITPRFGVGAASVIELHGKAVAGAAAPPIPQGSVLVVSLLDGRVETFNDDGVYQHQFAYTFAGAFGVAVDADSVYVADRENRQVFKFDSRGVLLFRIGASGSAGPGVLNGTGAVALDGDGHVWATSNYNIQEFDSSGKFLKMICLGPTAAAAVPGCPAATTFDVQPLAIAFDSCGDIYVTNTAQSAASPGESVVKLNRAGQYLSSFGSEGTGNGQFGAWGPAGIAVDAKGSVYVADQQGNRIEVFDQDGNYKSSIGSTGTGPGQLADPVAISFDHEGALFVTDSANDRVQKFSAAGAYLGQFGSNGLAPGKFEAPIAIAIVK